MYKKILLILCLFAIFCLALLVWYSPIIFKGYHSGTIGSDPLVRARNYALLQKYSSENNMNVILAPELIKEQGQLSKYGNKIGSLFYSYLIKLFNPTRGNSIVLINVSVLALALVFFTLTVYYLFNFKTSFIFSLLYIFLPSNWFSPQVLVANELAILFLSLFFLFFSIGSKKFWSDNELLNKNYGRMICLFLAGIFLSLAGLSRESFLIILPILFLYLLVSKKIKDLIYVFVPIIIIIVIFWLPTFFGGQNTYLLFFAPETQSAVASADFAYYAHLIPDPYIYHFEKDEFIRAQIESQGPDLMSNLGQEKVLTNMGYSPANLWQRLQIGTPLLLRHVFRLFSLTEIGGPLIFLLFCLGMYLLKKQKRFLYVYFMGWLIGGFVLLAYFSLAGRNHLDDFGFLIALTAALGLIFLARILSQNTINKQWFTEILLVLIIIYNLVLTGHILWGREYDRSSVPLLTSYNEIISEQNVSLDDVIAAPLRPENAYYLNFISGKSIVVLTPASIEKMIVNKKVDQVFGQFGITHILGYSPEMSEQILQNTSAKLISDSNIEIKPEEKMDNKNWFLNLVK